MGDTNRITNENYKLKCKEKNEPQSEHTHMQKKTVNIKTKS